MKYILRDKSTRFEPESTDSDSNLVLSTAMHHFVLFRRQHFVLSGSFLFLVGSGLLALMSIEPVLFRQQLLWFALGLCAAIVCAVVDIETLMRNRGAVFGVYASALFLLAVTGIFGTVIRGARSWLVFGPAQFQTSEFAKLALIVVLSAFFAKAHIGIARPRIIAISFLYAALPIVLVLLQPDLGTALVLGAIWVGYLLVSGIKWRHLAAGALLAAVIGALSWNLFLKDYQRARIYGFFQPAYDPLGVNYNVIQSKIAIGSAGFWGKGFGGGTQTQLGFLPEAPRDFILASFIEEWGIGGGLLLLAAFLAFVLSIVRIGLVARGNFGRLFCLGAACALIVQFFMNAGSAIGLFPVVGLPLPLVSYGGSSLFTTTMFMGIVQGISIRASFFRT